MLNDVGNRFFRGFAYTNSQFMKVKSARVAYNPLVYWLFLHHIKARNKLFLIGKQIVSQ